MMNVKQVKWLVFLLGAIAVLLVFTYFTAKKVLNAGETIEIPNISVNIGDTVFENQRSETPIITHQGMIYYPLNENFAGLLDIKTEWDEETGWTIWKSEEEVMVADDVGEPRNKHKTKDKAAIADSAIRVNGKMLYPPAMEYPVLLYRDVLYFPLTSDLAEEEFGIHYTLNAETLYTDATTYREWKDRWWDAGEYVYENAGTGGWSRTFTDGENRLTVRVYFMRAPVAGNLKLQWNDEEEYRVVEDGWMFGVAGGMGSGLDAKSNDYCEYDGRYLYISGLNLQGNGKTVDHIYRICPSTGEIEETIFRAERE